MNLGFEGKKAIVTAASRGLGRAVALRLAEEGVELAICARGPESLRRTKDDIQRAGGRVFSATADLTDEKQIKDFVAESAKQLGGLDISVNNAGGPKTRKVRRSFRGRLGERFQSNLYERPQALP
jgi:3-oxoacyl-[acyl-carrier protein] reductase